MKTLQVKLEGKVLFKNIKEAKYILQRMKGLMFQKKEMSFEGMLIQKSNSIHTFFMNFAINAYFLNKNNVVVKVYSGLVPKRVTFPVWEANKVLEIPSEMDSLNVEIKVGDTLEFEYV